jgi:hypothetical protein
MCPGSVDMAHLANVRIEAMVRLTMSLSGRLPTQIARCARTISSARTARLLSSHGRSKRGLECAPNSGTVRAQHGTCKVGDIVSHQTVLAWKAEGVGSTQPPSVKGR